MQDMIDGEHTVGRATLRELAHDLGALRQLGVVALAIVRVAREGPAEQRNSKPKGNLLALHAFEAASASFEVTTQARYVATQTPLTRPGAWRREFVRLFLLGPPPDHGPRGLLVGRLWLGRLSGLHSGGVCVATARCETTSGQRRGGRRCKPEAKHPERRRSSPKQCPGCRGGCHLSMRTCRGAVEVSMH